jgi:chemotaxis protein methyltransferase CheR
VFNDVRVGFGGDESAVETVQRNDMSLDTGDFDYVCTLLRKQSGIGLDAGKEYLVETRLQPVAKQAGYASLAELITRLRSGPLNHLHVRVVEALMTNETQFFRDIHPFNALKTLILPELFQKRSAIRQLNVWCAAASTGQEPYSVAMLLADSFPNLAGWNVRCIASDISDGSLARARQGSYRQLEVKRGLPVPLLEKYFCKHGAKWQIAEQIRRRVEFRNINLVSAWPSLPQMDIIMMRNVLIYLDVETKKAILGKVRTLLKPDGYLFLGSAETTLNLDTAFDQVRFDKSICYQLK